MIPNEYLYYFYYGAETVSSIRESPQSRGAFLLEQQAAFYDAERPDRRPRRWRAWRATRHDRERTYMAEARGAAGVDRSTTTGAATPAATRARRWPWWRRSPTTPARSMILNTANRSALPFLDERAVVEVPALVGRAGPVPVAIGPVPAHAQALVTTIKDVERTTIEAALTGSAELAVRALALHPLVPSVPVARRIFDGYRERLPELQEHFA